MKYSIYINQFCWEKNNFHSLDIIDLAIYDFIKVFMLSKNCEYIVVEQVPYYWINPQIVIKEMPILGITTTRNVNRRIDNLINAGLLQRCPNNKSERKTYLTTGERYNQYECYHPDEEEKGDKTQKSEDGQICPSGTWTEMSKNNNTNIDKNINKEIIKENELNFPYHSQEFMDIWHKVIGLKKWKPKTASQLQFSLNRLAKISEQDAIKCLEATFENGYQGVFTEKYLGKAPTPRSSATPPSPRPKKEKWEELGMRSEEEYRQYLAEIKK